MTNTGLALSHIGITVPDLDAALEWYSTVLGFQVQVPPAESSTDTPDSAMMRQMLGPRFGTLRYAMVSTGSGVSLELFESVEPPTQPAPQPPEFWRAGPWHIAVTCDDIEALVATIQEKGGTAVSPVNTLAPGTPFRICMCVDPFGVNVEVYSHSIEEIVATLAG